MKKPLYINGMSCISAQETARNSFFETIPLTQPVVKVRPFPFKEFIKPMQLRRMSTAVRLGVVGAQLALRDANIQQPDAIITGTGMGCRQDSIAFLFKMLENDEQFVNPTQFIQSTHNTIGGQIALNLGCQAYNTTYVQASASLEASLIDGLLMTFENPENSNLLIGSIDEIDDTYVQFYQRLGHVRQDAEETGVIKSEGAGFFVCSAEKNEKSYAQLLDVEVKLKLDTNQVNAFVSEFLEKNQVAIEDIDAVVLGNNGDAQFDGYYHELQRNLFAETSQLHYKHLSGEHNSASAFSLWLGCIALKSQTIPKEFKLNNIDPSQLKTILHYNQYRGTHHSLMLLQRP